LTQKTYAEKAFYPDGSSDLSEGKISKKLGDES